MPGNWYMTRDGNTEYGPFDDAQLKELARSGRIQPTDKLWQEGMPKWIKASSVKGLFRSASSVVAALPPVPPNPVREFNQSQGGNKIAAGVFGILLGGLGIHKFILGLTVPGIIMLLVTILSCGWGWLVMGVIGLIEGILYLSKTDEDFYQTYIVEKRGWF